MARTGRPEFKPTKGHRDRVMRLRADGWSIERIARVMALDFRTVAKHFATEIEHGADVKTDELLEFAERGAKKGNAANIKWLSERYRVARASRQIEDRAGQAGDPAPAPKPEKLGKKEERLRAAQEITGKFAPPPPPKLH